jgi:hypothetical protein
MHQTTGAAAACVGGPSFCIATLHGSAVQGGDAFLIPAAPLAQSPSSQ